MTRGAGTVVRSLGSRTPSGLRTLLAMLALTLGLGVALIPLSPARADDGDLVVELTGVTPAVVTTGDELVITGRVQNNTDATLEAPAVRLMLQLHVPSSVEALDAWLDGTSDLNVRALTGWNTAEDAPEIPAGGSVPFTINLPTDGTFSQLSAWGPRGVEIQARSGGLEGAARTTMLWFPTDPAVRTPSELALLVPLTPTAQEWADAVEQQVPVLEIAAPRLLEVLDAVGLDASLAIDPALLEQVPPGSVPTLAGGAAPGTTEPADETPSTEATEGATDDGEDPGTQVDGPAREVLIDRLTDPQRRGDLIALGYADADVTALVGAGGADLWADGVTRSEALLAEAGLAVESVAWPASGLSAPAAATLVDRGAEAVVLDAADYTIPPTTHATASFGSGDVQAVLADQKLGAALGSSAVTGVTGRQATLALSAVLSRAVPDEGDGFLLVLPRDIGSEDLGNLSEQIESLQQAPWFEPATLRSLLGRTGPGVVFELPRDRATSGGISPTAVDSLLDGREVVDAYTAAAGPTIREAYVPTLLNPLGSAFAGDPQLREQLLGVATTAIDDLGSQIHVEAGSDLTLISEGGNLPVTLTNRLSVEAVVTVSLVPGESMLQAREPVTVALAPQESTVVRIPTTAVANGNVMVDIHVHPAAAGAERDLAEPASFTVRVRAEWENIGTAVVGGLLAVAFVIGMIRTIRRGGRRADAQ